MLEFIKSLPWTAILSVVVTVFCFVFKHVFATQIKPYLEDKGLSDACAVAVSAAEAAYGREHGAEKLEYALDMLKQQGWNVESKLVVSYVEAAWQDFDLFQRGSGLKDDE